MTPYYSDDWLTVYHGDTRAVMAEMEPGSVHCVVTSPPYWGLRDYGTATWLGGDEGCDHIEPRGTILGKMSETFHGSNTQAAHEGRYKGVCAKCGATRQDAQLGLEPTPEEYVANMVDVFREVRRVLRSDGTVWLNLGDSYANNGSADNSKVGGFTGERIRARNAGLRPNDSAQDSRPRDIPSGLKPKDLVGIPWRVAFALQADGWYLRSDVIWSKPNPMPESVTDRPTKSHEYLFLLSKSPRYYFDADAVREPHRWQDPALLATNAQARQGLRLAERRAAGDASAVRQQPPLGREKGRGKNGNAESEFSASSAGRNIRSVWTIATAPYPGAHFATFPPKLVEPCIKAGTSERGVCPECGAPWVRVTETSTGPHPNRWSKVADAQQFDASENRYGAAGSLGVQTTTRTLSWIPSCAHDTQPVPATVLDPFAGSGTTGMVAQSLSRRAVLIDLSMEYLEQLMERNRDIPMGLAL